jgi:Mce-associated membrane protein
MSDVSTEEPPSVTIDPVKPSGSRWSGLSRWAVPAVIALAMIASLVVWWRAAHDESLDLAKTRDAVLISATTDIETMNSLDYRSTEKGLDAWLKVTTGTLHDQIAQVSDEDKKLLADQGKISVGKVVDAAVTSVDPTKASVIASVEVTVADGEDSTKEATVKRNRFSADLVLVRGHWLLERLEQVAVSVS